MMVVRWELKVWYYSCSYRWFMDAMKILRSPFVFLPCESKGIHSGRFLGISLHFPNFDSHGKKTKGDLKIFMASIYHPYEQEKYQTFNPT